MIADIIRKLTYLRKHSDFKRVDDHYEDGFYHFGDSYGNSHLSDVYDHRYRIGPPLGEAKIAAVEAAHGITLPEGYCAFLLEVGNGGVDGQPGPGPGYELLSLDDSIQHRLTNRDGLAAPFPYTHHWNPNLQEYPSFTAREEEIYRPEHIQGTLVLGHAGCGMHYRLVVSGQVRGSVWLDDRGSDNGIWPMVLEEGRVSDLAGFSREENPPDLPLADFLTWYEHWLNWKIAETVEAQDLPPFE